jgi:MFS family permease
VTDPAPDDRAGQRRLLVASTTALVLAATVTVTLHELAHAVAGLALGLVPTLHSNVVSYEPEPTDAQAVVTAAAGPLFSLALGLVVHLTTRLAGRGTGRLFWMWAGLLPLQNFAGYLVIAPFARAGDTGRVLALLDAPTVVYVVAFVVGVVLTLLNSRLLAGQVTRYGRTPDELRHLVLFPWLIGTGVVVLLTLASALTGTVPAADLPVIVAGAVATAIFAPMFTFFYRRLRTPYEGLAVGRTLPWVIGTAVLALLVIAVLGPGLRLG